jgi:hypothetical protein
MFLGCISLHAAWACSAYLLQLADSWAYCCISRNFTGLPQLRWIRSGGRRNGSHSRVWMVANQSLQAMR